MSELALRNPTTVQELIDMLTEVEDKSLPVLVAIDDEVNGYVWPQWVAPQDRSDDEEPGPPRFVLVGTDDSPLGLEDSGWYVEVDPAVREGKIKELYQPHVDRRER